MSKKTETQASAEVLTTAELPQEAEAVETDEVVLDYEAVVVMPEVGLNLRGAPTVEAPIVTVLPQGTVLQVLQLPEEEGWCPVLAGVCLGWVDSRYVEPVAPNEEG